MTTHAMLSPSKAHRYLACPGSIREEAKFPDESGAAAVDGDASELRSAGNRVAAAGQADHADREPDVPAGIGGDAQRLAGVVSLCSCQIDAERTIGKARGVGFDGV